MEDRIGVARHHALDQSRVGEVAGDHPHASIVDLGGCHVEQQQFADFMRFAVCVGERTAREDGSGEAAAQKAGAAGDHDAHDETSGGQGRSGVEFTPAPAAL